MSEERGGCGAVWIAIIIGFLAVSAPPLPSSAASQPNPCPLGSGSATASNGMPPAASLPVPLNPCPGFEWAKTFGTAGRHDSVWGLDITSDGGAVLLIRTQTESVSVVKLDGEGTVQWQKQYALTVAGASGIQQTSDGGFIWSGFMAVGDPATWGIVVFRLDALGDIVWQAGFDGTGEDLSHSVAETQDGGYIVGAHTTSFGAGDKDLWVLRLSPTGEILWQRTFGTPGNERAYAGVFPTPDGGFAAAGYGLVDGVGGGWLLKMDAFGNVVWQKVYKGTSILLSSLTTTTDGGYAFTAYANGRWLVVKLTSSGSIAWQRTYGNAPVQDLGSITQTADGGYLASMNVADSFGSVDFALLRLDASGNRVWQRSYGGPSLEMVCSPRCLREAPDGNILVAGRTASFGTGGGTDTWTNSDAWVLRVFSDGSISSACDPTFGTEIQTPVVKGAKLGARNAGFMTTPSAGVGFDPGASASPGTLVQMTQCSA